MTVITHKTPPYFYTTIIYPFKIGLRYRLQLSKRHTETDHSEKRITDS